MPTEALYYNINGKFFDQARNHPPLKNAFLLCIKLKVQNIVNVAFNYRKRK